MEKAALAVEDRMILQARGQNVFCFQEELCKVVRNWSVYVDRGKTGLTIICSGDRSSGWLPHCQSALKASRIECQFENNEQVIWPRRKQTSGGRGYTASGRCEEDVTTDGTRRFGISNSDQVINHVTHRSSIQSTLTSQVNLVSQHFNCNKWNLHKKCAHTGTFPTVYCLN